MDATARLLEDIRHAPDDDAPRLVWADAVGGERGELVVIQCELAAGKLAPRDAIVRRKRQRELLARHGATWSGLAGIATQVSYSRGFVDAAEIAGRVFVENVGAIREAAPLLSSVSFDDDVDRLFRHPEVRALRGVATDGAVGDFVVEELVATGAIDSLQALAIRNTDAGESGVRALLAKRALPNIERLVIGDYMRGDAIGAFLGIQLPALRSLEFERSDDMAEVVALLPATVYELSITKLDATGLAALADSAVAGRLELLGVPTYAFRDQTHRLAAFSRLCALSLWGAADDEILSELAAIPLPALRELALDVAYARGETMTYVGAALGPQLELFDARGSLGALRHLNDIKVNVAGELLVGNPWKAKGLLRTTPTIQMPWWDHVNL